MANIISPAVASAIILVVEDEPIQRMALVDLVEDAGFEPLEAWDAASAVAILEKRTDVRIVFSDIDMPGGMDGMQLAAMVRDRWPPIELILTSAGPAPKLDNLPARAIFLPKPLVGSKVVDALKQFNQHVQ